MTAASRLHPTIAAALAPFAPPAPRPAPPTTEPCPDCDGYGHVACCYAWEVEGRGGPRGCYCRRPGVHSCARCDGSGEIEPEPEEVEE